MQILILSSALDKEYGGPPIAIVNAAVSLAKRGHQITIFVFGQSQNNVLKNEDFYAKLKSEKIEVITAKSWTTRVHGGLGNISDVVNLFKKVKSTDLVSIHQVYNFQNIVCALFALVTRTPISIMPHGTLTRYQRKKHFLRKIFFQPIFVWLLLKPARTILVASEIEKDEINPSLKAKTCVVGLGVLIEEIDHSVDENDNGENVFNFLYMSRIAPKKRLDIAIEAFFYLPVEIRMRSKLVICGDGKRSYVKSMANKVKKLSLVDCVDFKGWVSYKEKSEIMKNANCFLLTSEDENFAIAAGEALAYGIPCILSSKVALSSIVEKYSAGKVFFELQPSSVSKLMLEVFETDKNLMRIRALRASQELNWELVSINWEREFLKTVGNLK